MKDKELRPLSLKDYIGQEEIKEQILVSIEASKIRERQFPHILFYGSSGLGKTTLSQIIASEFNSNISFANAANIIKPADLISYIINLEDGDFLFIDEIHRLKKEFEEMLYTVMEDYRADIITQTGSDMTPVSINLPKFTLVGATTLKGRLSQPLVERFGIKLQLREYTNEELVKIIKRTSDIFNVDVDEDASMLIAKSSRGTPRKANHILDRIVDFAVCENKEKISRNFTQNILNKIGIDEYGLEEIDRDILISMRDDFNCRPVGLSNLAASSGQEKDTLENIIEPFLLKNKFITRTPKGRKITEKGKESIRGV